MSQEVTIGIVLFSLFIVVVGLFLRRFKPTYAFITSVFVLFVAGLIKQEDILNAMVNESILTIFLLIFLTQMLKDQFNLLNYFDRFFGKIKSTRLFITIMTTWVAGLSSVINNTPIVSIMIPYVYQWGKERNISPSRLLMPMAYAATLGGMITIIGTSTNLVLNGLIVGNGFEALHFSDFLVPGLLVTAAGIVYFTLAGDSMLPSNQDLLAQFKKDSRAFVVETRIPAGSDLAGKTVEEANLRNLKGMFLAEILRNGEILSPINPKDKLESGDHLFFAGDISQVVSLVKETTGLEIPKVEKYHSDNQFNMVEAVIPTTSNLAGRKVRETNFRQEFDAAIIAIHRKGERLGGRIGDVVLEYGDLLLLTTGSRFNDISRKSKNIYAINTHHQFQEKKSWNKKAFAIIMMGILGVVVWGNLSLLMGLVLLLGTATALKLYKLGDTKRNFNIDLFIILVGALLLGQAMIDSGTASWLGEGVVGLFQPFGIKILLAGLFFFTLFLTSFVTNVAAVAVLFPIVAGIVEVMGIPAKPLFLTIAFGASAAFLTPVAYQTNLMVYGPGGYKAKDFLKFGLPLTIIYSLICIAYFSGMI